MRPPNVTVQSARTARRGAAPVSRRHAGGHVAGHDQRRRRRRAPRQRPRRPRRPRPAGRPAMPVPSRQSTSDVGRRAIDGRLHGVEPDDRAPAPRQPPARWAPASADRSTSSGHHGGDRSGRSRGRAAGGRRPSRRRRCCPCRPRARPAGRSRRRRGSHHAPRQVPGGPGHQRRPGVTGRDGGLVARPGRRSSASRAGVELTRPSRSWRGCGAGRRPRPSATATW